MSFLPSSEGIDTVKPHKWSLVCTHKASLIVSGDQIKCRQPGRQAGTQAGREDAIHRSALWRAPIDHLVFLKVCPNLSTRTSRTFASIENAAGIRSHDLRVSSGALTARVPRKETRAIQMTIFVP